MRLVDRVFAFRRPPAWSDPVQVLLWLLGWGVLLIAAGAAVIVGPSMARSLLRGGGEPLVWVAVSLGALLVVLLLGASCWSVSEAYRGWRAGHPHGRQWAFVISLFLLFAALPLFAGRDLGQGRASLAFTALRIAFGLALLVAALTTRPPAAPQPLAA